MRISKYYNLTHTVGGITGSSQIVSGSRKPVLFSSQLSFLSSFAAADIVLASSRSSRIFHSCFHCSSVITSPIIAAYLWAGAMCSVEILSDVEAILVCGDCISIFIFRAMRRETSPDASFLHRDSKTVTKYNYTKLS
jgi:hypothetical protein